MTYLVMFMLVYSHCSKPGFNILALAVLPQTQGKGIGKKFLTQGLEQEAENVATSLRLNSADHRISAHAFYESWLYL